MRYTGTLMAVKDVEASKKFYTELMGETIQLDIGANVGFDSGFFLLDRQYWGDFINKNPEAVETKSDGIELVYETEDLDGFIARKDAFGGVEMVHGIKTFPWGQRVIRFYDPDGHMIEMGESMEFVVQRFLREGKSVEEVMEITMYPEEYVKMCQSKL